MKALLLRITASFGTAFLAVLAFCFVAHAAPQTFTVTSNADDPAVAPAVGCATVLPDCTLRSAIEAANANGNPGDMDVIEFNIGGGGHQVITPASIYDNIIEPVNINGETQPGSSCGTLVPGIPSGSNTPHVLNIEIDDTALSWLWFVPGSDEHAGLEHPCEYYS
jgi:CSLREA domain-containing protein